MTYVIVNFDGWQNGKALADARNSQLVSNTNNECFSNGNTVGGGRIYRERNSIRKYRRSSYLLCS